MAGYMCDSQDETPAHVVISNTTNGEVFAFCGPCLAEWLWGMVEALPDYDDQMKARMVALVEKSEAATSAAEKRKRRTAKTAQAGEATDPIAGGEDTPDEATGE